MKTRTTDLINDFFNRYSKLYEEKNSIVQAINTMIDTAKNDNKILICGNGGSAADCEHISGELLKGFLLKRKIQNPLKDSLIKEFGNNEAAEVLQYGLQALPLPSFSSAITAFMNDCKPEYVFAQEVLSLGRKNDLLICISTSGNSLNILHAAHVAKVMKMKTIALTGASGGKLLSVCDTTIKAPDTQTFIIQEYHLPIYHLLCATVESELYAD